MNKDWNIKDAKPGDILSINGMEGKIAIFKEFNGEDYFVPYLYCWIEEDDHSFETYMSEPGCVIGCHEYNHIRPATGDEINMLYKKLSDLGYTWDDEKLKLLHVTPNGYTDVEKDIEREWALAITCLPVTKTIDELIEAGIEPNENEEYREQPGIIFTKSDFYQLARELIDVGYNLKNK